MQRKLTQHETRPERGKVWLRKCSSFEEEKRADHEFWQRMTPDERVEIVEELREEWWKEHGDGKQGLRRAVRVLERT